MDIEQLKQENEKLNARLKKAITVFNEQKETISRLTEERDSAVSVVEVKDALITDLRNKIAEKDADDTKFFEQLQEIDSLNDEIQNQKTLYDGLASQLSERTKQLDEKTKECANLDSIISDLDETISDKNSEIAQLEEKNEDLEKALDNLTSKYETTIAQYTALTNNMVQMVKDRTVSLVKDVEKLNNPG